VLWCVAVCCSVLHSRRRATACFISRETDLFPTHTTRTFDLWVAVGMTRQILMICCGMVRCKSTDVAVCCSVLQCVLQCLLHCDKTKNSNSQQSGEVQIWLVYIFEKNVTMTQSIYGEGMEAN